MAEPYLLHPVDAPYSDRFGWREAIPGVVGKQLHNGDDYKALHGTPIYAAAPGVVVRKWWDTFANGAPAGGNMVRLSHGYVDGDLIETEYAHMADPSNKEVGDWCTNDSVVGIVGSTGAATAQHLHFSMLRNGEYVDPSPYMHDRNTDENGDIDMPLTDAEIERIAQRSAQLVLNTKVQRTGIDHEGKPRTGTQTVASMVGAYENQFGITRRLVEAIDRGVKTLLKRG